MSPVTPVAHSAYRSAQESYQVDMPRQSTRKRGGVRLRQCSAMTPRELAGCVGRVPGVEDARDGSLAGMFDHVGIAVSDLAASERFYRIVLSALGVEPSYL